jgi:branched-chain amino acid aminotransferase
MKVSIDDSLCDGSEAKVSVFDHGLLYGDGLFEGMRVFGRRLFCFDQQTLKPPEPLGFERYSAG